GHTRELHVGNIRTSDQQDKCDSTHQQQRVLARDIAGHGLREGHRAKFPAFVVFGISLASRWAMACISAEASEKETRGFRRPSTQSHRLSRRSRSLVSMARGIQASAGNGKSKPLAMTPTTVKLLPSTLMFFPRMCSSEA